MAVTVTCRYASPDFQLQTLSNFGVIFVNLAVTVTCRYASPSCQKSLTSDWQMLGPCFRPENSKSFADSIPPCFPSEMLANLWQNPVGRMRESEKFRLFRGQHSVLFLRSCLAGFGQDFSCRDARIGAAESQSVGVGGQSSCQHLSLPHAIRWLAGSSCEHLPPAHRDLPKMNLPGYAGSDPSNSRAPLETMQRGVFLCTGLLLGNLRLPTCT